MAKNSNFGFLSSNGIKLIALVLMTVDHVGMLLFPHLRILRILGRLSMPLFAFMISEGCRYTKNRKKYLLRLAVLGAAFQAVYIIFERDFFFNVFITFSIAVSLCIFCDLVKKMLSEKKLARAFLLTVFAAFLVWFVMIGLNTILPVRISFDGGFFGIFLPVMIYLAPGKWLKLLAMALGCTLIAIDFGGIQYYCILSVFIAAFYNGKRGKLPLKTFFYIYYPAHLAVLYGIDYLMG